MTQPSSPALAETAAFVASKVSSGLPERGAGNTSPAFGSPASRWRTRSSSSASGCRRSRCGSPFFVSFPGRVHRPAARSRCNQSMRAGGEGIARMTRMVRPDGTVRWVRVFKVLVRDDQGRPQAFHAQYADMTEQYEAEERAARFEALAHSSPDFIAISGESGHLEYLNPAGRRLIGLPPDVDITTLTGRDILPTGTDFDAYGVTGTSTVLGVQSVTVPAGTFRALAVRTTLRQPGFPFGSGTRTSWFAPGKGLVKLVFSHGDGSTSQVVLIKK